MTTTRDAQPDRGNNIAKHWLDELMGDYDITIPSDAYDELIEALSAPTRSGEAAGEPVAWRIKIGGSDIWGYADNEWQADFYGKQSGLKYEKQPVYTHPAAATTPAAAVGVPDGWEDFIRDCAANRDDVHIASVRSERAIALLAASPAPPAATPNAHVSICAQPPAGWYCTRPNGHSGPCAARLSSQQDLLDRVQRIKRLSLDCKPIEVVDALHSITRECIDLQRALAAATAPQGGAAPTIAYGCWDGNVVHFVDLDRTECVEESRRDGSLVIELIRRPQCLSASARSQVANPEKSSDMPLANPRTFWVVEKITNGLGGNYWDGGSSRSFTTDIEAAIQFCRKQDGLWVARNWHWSDIKLTEHMMIGRVQQP